MLQQGGQGTSIFKWVRSAGRTKIKGASKDAPFMRLDINFPTFV